MLTSGETGFTEEGPVTAEAQRLRWARGLDRLQKGPRWGWSGAAGREWSEIGVAGMQRLCSLVGTLKVSHLKPSVPGNYWKVFSRDMK